MYNLDTHRWPYNLATKTNERHDTDSDTKTDMLRKKQEIEIGDCPKARS